MKLLVKALKISALAAVLVTFLGCAAAQTAISKKDLEVQTKTSTTIFVDPVPPEKRKVYLTVRSGVMEFDRNAFQRFVMEQFALNPNGYRLTDNPDDAHYIMQVAVKNLEKTSQTAAQAALGQGYLGAELAGGAAVGYLASGGGARSKSKAAVGGAVAVAAGSFIANALVKDVYYMLVCDVQIQEKAAKGAFVRTDTQIDAKAGDSGTSRQTVSEVSNKKKYQTRIVTTANKVNLKLEQAQDLMFKKTAYAMSGFF